MSHEQINTHTPGPWYVGIDECKVELPRTGGTVKVGYALGARDIAKADARLIAAAPEMAAMLRNLADKIDRSSGSPYFAAKDHDAIVAILAKAGL